MSQLDAIRARWEDSLDLDLAHDDIAYLLRVAEAAEALLAARDKLPGLREDLDTFEDVAAYEAYQAAQAALRAALETR